MMTKAQPGDRFLVIELLAQSFADNRSVNYIVGSGRNRAARLKALMAYSFDICLLFGEVWLSPDRQACALILYPDKKKTTLRSIWLDARLVFQATGIAGASKALSREAKVKKRHPQKTIAYLWFIGVNPVYQHKGIGSQLLREVVTHAEKKDRPVYLETSTPKNLPWYEGLGFRVYDKIELGYTLYFLNNLPGSLAQ